MRPLVAKMESEANGKQAGDTLPRNKSSEPAIPSLLDCLQASQKVRAKAETGGKEESTSHW